MPTNTPCGPKLYALVDYEDPYVQPLILAALKNKLPQDSYQLIKSLNSLPSPKSPILHFQQYESLDFDHHVSNTSTSLCNSYVIRKALIRKHYLSTTVSNWITKHPDSVLAKGVKPSVEFEVDYAEFLDDALVEAWELKESWERGEGKGKEEREWWILKPGMSERGQGIRLFSNEDELVGIFEGWDPEEDEDEDDEVRSDAENDSDQANHEEKNEGNGIVTSLLRHFIAQPYIHPPLLLPPPSSDPSDQATFRKFHIRTYVLAVGALKVYVYKDMLALFATKSYSPPWESSNDEEDLKAHLTNTCLQETNEREGSVGLFWELPETLPSQPALSTRQLLRWKDAVFGEILALTGTIFEAASRSMSIHFQPLPNSFEIFGLDFMVGIGENGKLDTYLLEVNAFPDFRQTGDELKGLIEGLFEGVVDVAINPFFFEEREEKKEEEKMVRVLDIDLGRR
ncbi:tubulin-tyrosine ligase family protein [Dendryphion nanum]|uniref:Tubulin-tyrosine ligase family protein n=1 Tax=Dendryphion nanum TaxID=256645 RepID=A0A9P9EH78_9PLEO|nr:tubulin-tyrosine ligase family protein [Dendryphion nanum]